jgi:hypothetical protein
MSYRDILKKRVLRELEDPDWENLLGKEYGKFDIIWILADLVQEGQFVEKALRVAELYTHDPDPAPGFDNLNEKIEKGEDISNIYTVRGSVPWLLQKIVATFKTEYYPRVLNVLEELAGDESLYVRQQVPAALSALTINMYAKKNQDGTPFGFTDADKSRAVSLAWKMLRENTNYPRVLESVVGVFDKPRITLVEEQAQELLNTIFYDAGGILRPDYLTEHAAPYALFFAEYRPKFDAAFHGEWFRDFLKKLIKDSNSDVSQAPRLKTTLIWITWKQLEENPENYELFKKYIHSFFEGKFQYEPVGQFEFLVEAVLRIAPKDGVQLTRQMLEYLESGMSHLEKERRVWLNGIQEIIEKIAEISPGDLIDILTHVEKIIYLGAYVGDWPRIFSAYKLAPEDRRKELEAPAAAIYERIKGRYPNANLPANL